MEKKTVSGIVLIILLINTSTMAFSINSVSAALPVHNIDTGLDYQTIQEAIDANETLNGHTILADAGIYLEHLVVNKSLILMGEDRGTIIDGNRSGVVVSVGAENVTIEGFTIRNGGGKYSGISLCSSENNLINNNITNCWCGIRLENTSYNVIANNSITNNYNGISGWLWDENTVVGNSVTDNLLGIGMNSMRNTIVFNDIRNHTDAGITMSESYQNVIAGNNVLANNQGNFSAGIVIDGSYNNIFHNNIVNKGRQVEAQRKNIWDDGYPSGGNYWSDYNGSDLYGGPYQNETGSDGIGDILYIINATNEDRYPLMDPYPLPDMQQIYNEFYELLASFIELQSRYDNLESSYDDLVTSYNSLKAELDNLQSEYDDLQSKYNSLRNELYTTRNFTYTLLITTLIFITTTVTVYLATRKLKVKP